MAAYFYLRVAALMYAGGGLGEVEGRHGCSAALGAGNDMVGGSLIGIAGATRAPDEPQGRAVALGHAGVPVAGTVTTLNEQILLSGDDAATGADAAENGKGRRPSGSGSRC